MLPDSVTSVTGENRIHTVPQVGPHGCGEPCRDPLVHWRSLAKFTLPTFSPFSAAQGRTHKGGLASPSESAASLLKAYPTDASSPLSSLHVRAQTISFPEMILGLVKMVLPIPLFASENGMWSWGHCLKTDHVNCESKSHMQYALAQTLKTWSSLCLKGL